MGRRVRGLDFGERKKQRVNVPAVRGIFVWVLEIGLAVAIAYVFTYFFGVRSNIVGPSMAQQLDDGDEVFINRFCYKLTSPKSGDVIAFLPNGNTNAHYYVKRVVGVPGDTVQIQDGAVYVNGKPYEEKTKVSKMEDAGIAAEQMTLGEDEYFVLGDNRNNSEDSRYANIGNVKENYIIGKAWFRITSHGKFGFIK